ncbi:MAG: lipid kinase [Rhizobiaceae bacterium]|nr:lipid kinase [Rhizobiaceae bacterium]MCV0405448.1 lipid kinase [Rhizobiaceae bacterium]
MEPSRPRRVWDGYEPPKLADGFQVQKTLTKRALLVVNPKARRGTGSIAAARAVIEAAGIDVHESRPGPDEGIAGLIRAEADSIDMVVVGGGDGTLNAAAPALAETGLPLGVLPLGTANDFARTLGIPVDLQKAAAIIAAGRTGPVDLGLVNGHPFFNVASIGFSAELAGELSAAAKKRWGVFGYAVVAARLLARSRLITAWLDHDGTSEEIHTLQISVGNGRHYGGGMTVEETAAVDDGTLDVYSLEIDHWWRLLQLLPSLRTGTQARWHDVRAFRTTEVTIRTSKPLPVNTDGELTTTTPARFEIRPGAVTVFRP